MRRLSLYKIPIHWTVSFGPKLVVSKNISLINNTSYPFLTSVYVLELSDKLGILNWRNACLSYKLLYTILHELLFYQKPIFATWTLHNKFDVLSKNLFYFCLSFYFAKKNCLFVFSFCSLGKYNTAIIRMGIFFEIDIAQRAK